MSYKQAIQTLSSYIAEELNLPDKKQDRIRFGLELLVSTLMSLSTSLILAKLLGIFNSVLFILFASAVLKSVSGGIHLKTPWECALFGALFFNILGLTAVVMKTSIYNNWVLFLIISSLYIFISLLLWSPADVEEKPIKGDKKRKTLKMISVILSSILLVLVAVSFFVYEEQFALFNISVILGLLFQSSTISPAAYKLLEFYYQVRKL
ncbi:accessory gene regulator ArgB-like protein [Acetohalobium arabaticum]|uniref:Accessory gene regulator B n=1 Tax=Acetohalobium arabaticum (strain ATCC 49924 / DSM 5501 / Z-7288) TaxID=574087 RepID=D9QSG8_ACEAZ|nr:accessory gene regulator B family protein [Acetohalobium arabaticum]ADL13431.1 Accessory gene regulator B [Acetohalobium arabaticum DSM 5501]